MQAPTEDAHTRLVGWLKILLPLAALVLLSTMFLLARRPGDVGDIPFAEIEAIAREQRLSAPRFAGVADDGSKISIAADFVRPDPDSPNTFRLIGLQGLFEATDGTSLTLTSGRGSIGGSGRTAEFSELVRVETSSGYAIEATGLAANLETGVVVSRGALEIRAPFGSLTAGAMEIRLSEDGTGQQMVFKEGVRLVYDPSKQRTE